MWSSNSDRIAFGSDRKGVLDLYEAPINGNGAATPLVESTEPKTSLDWSRDGRFFLFTSQNQKTGNDLWIKPLFGDKKLYGVANTTFTETGARFSPDGRWIAYESDESGRPEIYVQPFRGPGRKLPISSDGGNYVRWSRDGREVVLCRTERPAHGRSASRPALPQSGWERPWNCSPRRVSSSVHHLTVSGSFSTRSSILQCRSPSCSIGSRHQSDATEFRT